MAEVGHLIVGVAAGAVTVALVTVMRSLHLTIPSMRMSVRITAFRLILFQGRTISFF